MWNPYTQNKRKIILAKSQWLLSCSLSPAGTRAAAGGLSNTVAVYNIPQDGPTIVDSRQGQAETSLHGHDGAVLHCRFAPNGADGDTLLTSSGDHTLKLWDINSKAVSADLVGHTGDVSCFEFTDVSTVVSVSTDASWKAWYAPCGPAQGSVCRAPL